MAFFWAPPQYRWTDLANSDGHDHRTGEKVQDRLEIDDWIDTFLELSGVEAPKLPRAELRRELKRLRTDILKIVHAVIEGEAPRTRDLDAFNHRYLERAAARPLLDYSDGRYELRSAACAKGVDGLVGYLARNFAETMSAGADRLKRCANPNCRWVMVDESRNRTRRWCETSACGNLVNVREYRARRSGEEQAAGKR